MKKNTHLFDYTKASNPTLPPYPVALLDPQEHETGPSRVVPFDLSEHFGAEAEATAPNLLCGFLHIQPGQSLRTEFVVTSQAFFVIRGSGETTSGHGEVAWKRGDLFVFPMTPKNEAITHRAHDNGAALYFVHDGPLLAYLGATPSIPKFEPAFFSREDMVSAVEDIRANPDSASKNRIGVLLGHQRFKDTTQTLTHTLWALFNVLPGHTVQPPHRHNAVALDLAIEAGPGVYTMMARDIDPEGNLIDPIRVEWASGGIFTTPPGWWHSHHNDTDDDAWVLPIQDAALYTYQRTLDIRFAKDEALRTFEEHKLRGAAFIGEKVMLPTNGHDKS